MAGDWFDRANLNDADLVETVAHGGNGPVLFSRLAQGLPTETSCNFVDLAVLPPGSSIGRHRHSQSDEEFYLVLAGEGLMWRDGEEFRVVEGDLVRNRAGGSHGLVNTGDDDLRLFVFEICSGGR